MSDNNEILANFQVSVCNIYKHDPTATHRSIATNVELLYVAWNKCVCVCVFC